MMPNGLILYLQSFIRDPESSHCNFLCPPYYIDLCMLSIFHVLLKFCISKSNLRGNTLSCCDWPFDFHWCLRKSCGGFASQVISAWQRPEELVLYLQSMQSASLLGILLLLLVFKTFLVVMCFLLPEQIFQDRNCLGSPRLLFIFACFLLCWFIWSRVSL